MGQIDWRIRDTRLNILCREAWERLPGAVKSAASFRLQSVYDIDEWSGEEKCQLVENGEVLWSAAKFNPTCGDIKQSAKPGADQAPARRFLCFWEEVIMTSQKKQQPSNPNDPQNNQPDKGSESSEKRKRQLSHDLLLEELGKLPNVKIVDELSGRSKGKRAYQFFKPGLPTDNPPERDEQEAGNRNG